ncbi:MAG: hypothetical protein M0001_04855 [Treponema sp.]|nr:hypothetical protein [Treponema sp.]
MALPAFVATILERLSPLGDKLPFLPKRKGNESHEPFNVLEDHSSADDDALAPNALPRSSGAKRAKVDFGAAARDLASRPAVIAFLAVLGLFVAALVTVALIANAPPPENKAQASFRPSTAEGRAAAGRLLLPPDPARDLSPPMERQPHFPYTDEDIGRLAPAHAPNEIEPIAKRNDRAMDAIFGAVP